MKKRVLCCLVLLMCFCFVPNVLATSISGCQTLLPGIEIDTKIPNTVHTVIVAIKIVVPILLVIFGMLDLFKGITAQKEDEIKKGQQLFVKRLIAAAIIFFVIQIVQLLVSFVSSEEPGIMQCAKCFLNGTEADGTCK